jgi:hypothetical protein
VITWPDAVLVATARCVLVATNCRVAETQRFFVTQSIQSVITKVSPKSHPMRRAGVFAGGLVSSATAGSLFSAASCKDGSKGESVVDAIGNTPLIELKSLSKATG